MSEAAGAADVAAAAAAADATVAPVTRTRTAGLVASQKWRPRRVA